VVGRARLGGRQFGWLLGGLSAVLSGLCPAPKAVGENHIQALILNAGEQYSDVGVPSSEHRTAFCALCHWRSCLM
jgi:hypothetical protein